MAEDGYDPLPDYTPPRWRQLHAEEAALQPGERSEAIASFDGALVCISPPAHSFLNSTFANSPRFLQREEQPFLWIHPQEARPRQIEDGARVRACNSYGEVTLTARVTEAIVPGTVLAPGVWWPKFSPDGRNINQTTPPDEADMGAGALFYDATVWVEPLSPGQMDKPILSLRGEFAKL